MDKQLWVLQLDKTALTKTVMAVAVAVAVADTLAVTEVKPQGAITEVRLGHMDSVILQMVPQKILYQLLLQDPHTLIFHLGLAWAAAILVLVVQQGL
jgi:hypothetical protein